MAKVKLLQLGKYYHPFPGGMETHLYDLCRRFNDKYEVHAIVANTMARTVHEVVDGVQVTRVANWGELFSNPVCPSFANQIRRVNGRHNSIVQIHLPNPMAHFSYLFAKPNGKLILMWHSDIIRQKILSRFYHSHLIALLKKADCVVATSPNYIRYSPYLTMFEDKCVVVPLGIETSKFTVTNSQKQKAAAIRGKYGQSLTLFVGRFTYYKGLDVLLQAANRIPGKIILIGDGPQKEVVRRLIKERGLENKIILVNYVTNEELISFYHACDVFVLPSTHRSEAFGIVQLEAMACGKPVVSTNLKTGVPWVNQHEKSGLVVEPGNVGALANAVNRLLINEKERKSFGEYGRERVEQVFSLDVVSQQMDEVYRQVLAGRPVKEFTFREYA